VVAVLEDQPLLRGIAREDREPELLVEASRGVEILDRQLTENAPSCMA
jgi:hypothetical protein